MRSCILKLLFCLLILNSCKTRESVPPVVTRYVSVDYLNLSDERVQIALSSLHNGYIEFAYNKLKEAAILNDLWAQFYLARCFELGIGVEKNEIEAYKLYKRVAERGLAISQLHLSICYKNGIGCASNIQLAAMWENKAQGRYNILHEKIFDEAYNEGVSKHFENYSKIPSEVKANKSSDISNGVNVSGNTIIINY